MYERNAIVLERYFEQIFKYKENSNLRANYSNYCKLVENLKKFNDATLAEEEATNEFEKASNDIKRIQKNGEKLYNKSAKLEYSRYIVFENIEEKTEEVKRCLSKIEKDVEKNNSSLKELDEEFIISSDNYKEKKSILFNCKNENENAKKDYEEILEKTIEVFENFAEEDIEFAKEFANSDNRDKKKELNNILNENGKNERNPFDNDVISNAVDVSFDVFKREIQIFLEAYEKTSKIIAEIKENDVKMDKHRKFLRDSKAKLDFLSSEKDYITGFLDNERIAAIYDKKIHRKLMLEACRNLNSDLVHIDNLYGLILKEASSRGSKRIYKENYNKNYLIDIEKTSEDAKEETNRLKANSVAVMNLNYWRIEGISRIQEIFEKDIKEIYGRDIEEIFPIEEKNKEIINTEVSEILEGNTTAQNETEKDIVKENAIVKEFTQKIKYKKLTSSKKVLELILHKNDDQKINDNLEKDANNTESKNNLYNESFGSTKNIGSIIDNELIEDIKLDETGESNDSDISLFEKISMLDDEEDEFDIKNYNEVREAEDKNNEEDSILDFYFKSSNESSKRKAYDEKKIDKSINKSQKENIFKKLIGINSKTKKEA